MRTTGTVLATITAVVAALPLLVGGAAGSAAALASNGPRSIVDPVGDASPATDIERVGIRGVGPQRGLLNVRVEFARREEIGVRTTVWFDTDDDGRPDLRLQGYRQSEYDLREVAHWFGPGRPADCDTYRQKGNRAGTAVVTRIGRDCLGRGPARVAVQTAQLQTNDHDWLGDARQFHGYRWTA
ncbi:MAG: hypothetical protein M3419_09535 [Actinomycetota bacterium]|nr:hypothetical protein [Actinomycetota bacterium]